MAINDYNKEIPKPQDQQNNSQPQILMNFDAIFDIWDVNHYPFNDATNPGKHKFCQFVDQTASGAPVTAGNEFALYNFDYNPGGGAVNQLVIKKPNTGQRVPFTSSGNTTEGWAWLPSGLLMKWGSQQFAAVLPATTITTASQNVVYPIGGGTIPPFSNTAYSIMITDASNSIGAGIDPNWHVYLNGLGDGLQFTIRVYRRTASNAAPSPIEFRWFAIGPAVAAGL